MHQESNEVFAKPRFQKSRLQNPGFGLSPLQNPGFKHGRCKTPVSRLARCKTPVSEVVLCKTPVSGIGFCKTPVSAHGLCKTPVSDAQNKTPVSSCISGPVLEVCCKSPVVVCKTPVWVCKTPVSGNSRRMQSIHMFFAKARFRVFYFYLADGLRVTTECECSSANRARPPWARLGF